MAPTGSSTSSSSASGTAASSSATAASSQDMFLQLLVAQLKYQDPLNPVDGTTFVTQLAEFQQLDQSISTGSDVASILQDLNSLVGNSGASSGTDTSGTSAGGGTGTTTNS
ncbi:MAG: flagellar hook capping FlgD N-terminal domain-containing protein [Bryobacteraceae bacterium]